MKRPFRDIRRQQLPIITYSEIPEEIWLHIIACCAIKNIFRQTCSRFKALASRKNTAILFHDQLSLSIADLKKFILYYADLGENNIVHNLLLCGADPNALGDHGMSVMSYAIQDKNINIINILLKHPEVSTSNKKQGESFCTDFTFNNHYDEINKRLISDVGMNKGVALSFFAQKNNSAMIEHIILSGANENDTREVLLLATLHGSIDVIRTLLAHNMSPNFNDSRYNGGPLHMAARKGYTHIAKLLVENGALINAKNSYFCTPLHCAIQAGRINTVQFLIDVGACPNTRGGKLNETCLVLATKQGFTKIVELLLNNHADINEKSSYGGTALHYALHYNHLNVMRKLLTYPELDINIQNDKGKTVLDIARNYRHREIVNLLLKKDT